MKSFYTFVLLLFCGNVFGQTILQPYGGGTGFGSYTSGDILYATSAKTLAKLPVGTNGSIMSVMGGVPTWTTMATNLFANSPLSINTNTISISQASGSVSGYLSSSDWNLFNNKQSILTFSTGLSVVSNTISLAIPVTIANGGTNNTSTLITNGVNYFNGTKITNDTNLKWVPSYKSIQWYDPTTGDMSLSVRGNITTNSITFPGFSGHYSNSLMTGQIANTLAGGYELWGWANSTANTVPFSIAGVFNDQNAINNYPAVQIRGGKRNGTTGLANLGATDRLLCITADPGGNGAINTPVGVKVVVLGDGSTRIGDGTSPSRRLDVNDTSGNPQIRASNKTNYSEMYTDGSGFMNLSASGQRVIITNNGSAPQLRLAQAALWNDISCDMSAKLISQNSAGTTGYIAQSATSSGLTANRIPYATSTGAYLTDNANFTVDPVNTILTIGIGQLANNNAKLVLGTTTTLGGVQQIGGSTNGNFYQSIQNTSAGASALSGYLAHENANSYIYMYMRNSGWTGNLGVTGIPNASLKIIETSTSGVAGDANLVIRGSPIFSLVNNSSGNYGTAVTTAGLLIDQIQNFTGTSVASNALHVKTGLAQFDGGIKGTTSTVTATAGTVGEIISSSIAIGSAVTFTTSVAMNITSISLTAGDWDVTGNVNFSESASTVSSRTAGISTTSATLPTDGTEIQNGAQTTLLSEKNSCTMATKTITVGSTTTVYLVGMPNFSAGSVSGYGYIMARRVR